MSNSEAIILAALVLMTGGIFCAGLVLLIRESLGLLDRAIDLWEKWQLARLKVQRIEAEL